MDDDLKNLLNKADQTIKFYSADPQGIGTTPCECAQRAIDTGWMELDPDCAAYKCKELRR